MSPAPSYGKRKKDPKQDIMILNKVIADEDFKPVHLLYGTEDYLRLQFRDTLTGAMGAGKGSLAYDRFIGPDTRPEQIIDLAETMPFMASRRVILIEDTGWFKASCPAIEEYIADGVCETTCIVFCEKEADKRLRLYKTVEKCGLISEFTTQTDDTLASWISGRLKSAGTPVSGSDAAYMVSVVGTDMLNLSNEADKLSAYCMGRQVKREDIDLICTRRLEDKVFDMCDAVASGNKKRAFGLYFDLIALRESPVKILVLVTRQYETLIRIKDLEKRGYNNDSIAQKTGRPYFAIDKYKKQSARYSMDELKYVVNLCADTDMAVKSGLMSDTVAMETLMVRLTGA